MLDINYIKQNSERLKKDIGNKKLSSVVDVDELISLHNSYLSSLKLVEELRNQKNIISDSISKSPKEERESLVKKASELKDQLKDEEEKFNQIKSNLDLLLLLVPNVVDENVPVGKDESENVVIKKIGKIPNFNFEVKDHVDLGISLDIIDTETASKVSGSRFYYLKNEAVFLEYALIRFVMDSLTNEKVIKKICKQVGNKYFHKFTPILPPMFVKAPVMKRMDRLDPIDDRYYYEQDDSCLVGSAEHTLGPMHMDKILNLEDLPMRYIGFSTSFRRESGTYGKDTRGILRTHQFDKLEMESFSTQETGKMEQDLMVGIQEYLVSSLGLPYQVIMLCTGDMGKPDYRQIDIETWMPGQNKYRETHTSDYMTDFQSRRLNTTYISKDGQKNFVHMNDATAFAIGRILIAILENNQQKDGSVVVPKVLWKYLNFKKILPKSKN